MMPYPPLGTLYAASYVRAQGYSVTLFDSMLAEGEHELGEALRRHRPKVVVIYDDDFNYLTKMCLTKMREAAFRMSSMARSAGCTVIVHGSDPADHVDGYLRHGADYVLVGEGEITLGETLDHVLRGKRERHEIPGLAYRKNDTVVRTMRRDVIRDLDTLPFPAWDLVDVERYRRLWQKHHGYFSVNMVTTRGCPYHCNWCAKPLYGQVYNSRSPGNVVREMQQIVAALHPDHIWFCDDIFGLKPGWVGEFSREVQRQGVVTPFKCLARADLLLRDSTVEHLRSAGCTSVWLGAESGSQKILDAMEKGTTVAQIYEARRRLHDAGIAAGFFLQYGYPGETWTEIEQTLAMLRDCMPDEIGISVSYPLPGTRFYESVVRQLGEKRNWTDSQDLAMLFAGEFAPDFYRALHTVTHKRFRSWQARRLLTSCLRKPRSINRNTLRRIAAGFYHRITVGRHESTMHALARTGSTRP